MSNSVAGEPSNQEPKGKSIVLYINYSRSCAIVVLFVLQSSADKRAHLQAAELTQNPSCVQTKKRIIAYVKHPEKETRELTTYSVFVLSFGSVAFCNLAIEHLEATHKCWLHQAQESTSPSIAASLERCSKEDLLALDDVCCAGNC